MIFIDWGDLENSKRLNDGDVVTVRFEDIDPNTSEFNLELAPHKTWWKGVSLLDNTDGQMGLIEVQDRKKNAGPISAPASDIEVGGHVVLWKAGFWRPYSDV